jgi:hypothetical protein
MKLVNRHYCQHYQQVGQQRLLVAFLLGAKRLFIFLIYDYLNLFRSIFRLNVHWLYKYWVEWLIASLGAISYINILPFFALLYKAKINLLQIQ